MEVHETDNSSSNLNPIAEASLVGPSDDFLHLALPSPPQRQIHFYGLCLIVIPTVTILGNLLVIVSILRFKTLHSAINFLILGLAVADLLVALFVMPYAVYIYVEGGYWFLGPLMCDIYSASDVACSTASILLLSVISFDRYRAVSRPIQYSRQSQNVQRVVYILIAIWLISLILACPIVLGANNRPSDADPYECRLYNPDFTIGSSIISFVIPCFIILFVYVRIIVALRAREKAAKLRRLSHQNAKIKQGSMKRFNEGGENTDEAATIVAGPGKSYLKLVERLCDLRFR
ncbi:unnamed protein product [Anisakis simplex]|uniref:G_PROTEIN_RECEP_F1_2 domain-containing protein n=1 Tax=Anisakis simplex TaxID=6269 RepID=A0A158PPC1_ANISI|nr:unnamed protein product [Anisakis simplex]